MQPLARGAPPRSGAAVVTAVASDVAAAHLAARFAAASSSGVVVRRSPRRTKGAFDERHIGGGAGAQDKKRARGPALCALSRACAATVCAGCQG